MTAPVNLPASGEAEALPAPRAIRVGLVFMTIGAVLVGGWILISPESFYRDFPGFGRHWVDVDGPFNEHLLRDVGSLNLALAVVTGVAAFRLSGTMIRAVCVAWLVYSVPHLLYHATHGSGLESSDFVAELVSLSFNLIIPACILVTMAMARPTRRSPA